ncbi:MAG: peptidylprolyl isomerase [Clostridia bacterium]|nr:peptidylprolyl isomerase [Clostridia bacterium]
MKTIKKLVVLTCICALMLSFAGCGLQISREIATVNGRMVTKAEFLYYLENVKSQMLNESGTMDSEGFWDAEIDGMKASDAAKNKALEDMLRVEIACIKAEEKGLTVENNVVAGYRNMVNSTDAQQKAQFDAIRELTGLSEDGLVDVLVKTHLANTLAATINEEDPTKLTPSDAEVKALYEQDYVHVKHVLIMSSDDSVDTSNMTPEEIEAQAALTKANKQELAKDVLAKAKAGANFDNLVKEYGEDPGMEKSPEGYTFTRGYMVPEFESASYALAVGEVSDLVESSYGWHIIKKYALPTSGEDYDNAINTIKANLSQDKYNALLDTYKSDVTIEIRQSVVDGVKVK